jgi:integrase
MRYIEQRQREGASNGTVNRELAALKRMFSLGVDSKKVQLAPRFPRLEERNVRKGFVEDAQYDALVKGCSAEGLWLRAMFEVAYSFGWRKSELLNLRVRQVDLPSRTIRLDVGETKNDEGRTAVMTNVVYALFCSNVSSARRPTITYSHATAVSGFVISVVPGLRSAQKRRFPSYCATISVVRPCATWSGAGSQNAWR